jgi:hypothetical protein
VGNLVYPRTVYTDCYEVYTGVIPAAQHKAITKLARKTNHLERFNNTLRQRVSRLVRNTLACSKKLANHIGAIRYFSLLLQSLKSRSITWITLPPPWRLALVTLLPFRENLADRQAAEARSLLFQRPAS